MPRYEMPLQPADAVAHIYVFMYILKKTLGIAGCSLTVIQQSVQTFVGHVFPEDVQDQ